MCAITNHKASESEQNKHINLLLGGLDGYFMNILNDYGGGDYNKSAKRKKKKPLAYGRGLGTGTAHASEKGFGKTRQRQNLFRQPRNHAAWRTPTRQQNMETTTRKET